MFTTKHSTPPPPSISILLKTKNISNIIALQMASPSDLSLEYKPDINQMIQKPLGEHPDAQKRIKEFLARLEEERLKIEAFKRELPLCMQLLNNAMETYAQQLEEYESSQEPKPVLEEFIPLKRTSIEGSSDAAAPEKASWMVSAQLALWSQSPKDCEPKLALDSKQRNGGAFLPFSKEKNQCAASTTSGGLPELALASSEKESREKSNIESGSKGGDVGGGKGGGGKSEGQGANQTQRKARRCWSPDLHRRFVNALQMLGGSQVATPKQIRELMKVDGLTNDEVKSHLQKYRLHTRRPISGPQPTAMAAGPPHLVVLGGIWVPPEYATSASAGAASAIYGAHPYGPHHHFYPTLHRNGAHKGRIGSPESEMRSGGERSEIVEEEEEEEEVEEEEEREEEDEDKAKAEMCNGGEVSINL